MVGKPMIVRLVCVPLLMGLALTPEALAHIVLYSEADLRGKYIRFAITVYALGGKISYRSLDNSDYEARVVWANT